MAEPALSFVSLVLRVDSLPYGGGLMMASGYFPSPVSSLDSVLQHCSNL